MSARKIINLAQPLVLNGEVDFLRDLSCRDVQVSGTITGGGITDDILGDDNTFTGKNDFSNTLTTSDITDPIGNKMLRKDKLDALAAAYTSVDLDNAWGRAAFSNAVNNPTIPANSAGHILADNVISSLGDLNEYISQTQNPLDKDNTFTGENDFIAGESKIVTAVSTIDDQAVSKQYVDGVIEIAGKTLTFSFNTPGSHKITPPPQPIGTIVKIDILMYGAGATGGGLSYYPAFNSFSIGDGNDNIPSFVLWVGEAQTGLPLLSAYASADVLPNNTYLTYAGKVMGGCRGTYTDDVTDPATPVLVQAAAMIPFQQTTPIGLYTQGNQVNVAPTPFGCCPFENVTRGVGTATSNGRIDVIVHYS